MIEKRLSPKEYYKWRHPELFSDTKKIEEINIDINVLGYTFETITAKNQETAFQTFCYELVKREICSNLTPQTGPTGGGDGKSDTETYPISDSLIVFGQDTRAATERWAFAISSSKKWKEKAKSDFNKILKTKRGYSIIYYISNQYISDKKKREFEDEFSNANTDVRFIVLDKTWLIEKSTMKKNQFLLKEYFSFPISESNEIGKNDYSRKIKLLELNEKYVNTGDLRKKIQISSEIISLTRQQEVSKKEIYPLLDEHIILTKKLNDELIRFDALYHTAWTVYWWYEDYEKFQEYYSQIEIELNSVVNKTSKIALQCIDIYGRIEM